VLLPPLAWSLGAAPPDLARGVAADYGMLIAALITAGLIIWRDRTSSPAWQTVTAGLLLALMIAWSGREDVLAGPALVLVAVTLVQAIKGHARPPHARPIPPPSAITSGGPCPSRRYGSPAASLPSDTTPMPSALRAMIVGVAHTAPVPPCSPRR
jgi:MFS superfamily sulfate permease-like transporter